MKFLFIIFTLLMTTLQTIAQDFFYAVAKEPAPVLNSPDFQSVFGGNDGMSIKTDNQGLIREMEFIALPGTVFDLMGEYDHGSYKIFKVECREYQYNTDLYVDSRFVELKKDRPSERIITLPSQDEIYKSLDKFVGNRDCWGIMYEAAGGYTPRNTSKLIDYGEGVEIEGLSAVEIASKLKPLDMIVWNGHVIYVYDEKTSIQSSLSKGGVVKLDLVETLKEVISTRKPVNDYNSTSKKRFVIRRWYNN